ncbi:DoxX family protein [Streptomyces sp. NPDC051985]|uniref:DoxX family protein n=1 Tax=Streptomyces sp. NPDC051985 TaxID=3155807 RepID=UPI003416ED61
MNVLLWLFQSLLAVAFLAVAGLKIVRSRERLASVFGWVEDFPDAVVKGTGLLDGLVGLGLVLPAATGIAPVLVPWAAVGGVLLAGGGAVVHLRRSETAQVGGNLVWVVLLLVIAWGRFGAYAF